MWAGQEEAGRPVGGCPPACHPSPSTALLRPGFLLITSAAALGATEAGSLNYWPFVKVDWPGVFFVWFNLGQIDAASAPGRT